MLIALQVQDGKFGPQVSKTAEKKRPGNTIVQCNKNGKLIKDIFKYWVDVCAITFPDQKSSFKN